jgi:hypothetical protein
MTDKVKRWTKCTLLGRGESFDVREDRVTETDIELVERYLHSNHGECKPGTQGARDVARELLSLVFGGEASRG